MRIANVIEEGKLGGPQVRMVRVAAALGERGLTTTIVMPEENAEAFRARCDAAGVDWTGLPLSRITREWRVALRYLLLSPVEVLRLSRLVRRGGFALVHASGGSWQYKAVVAARIAGLPVVWHLNDTRMPAPVRKAFAFFQRYADGFIFASHRSRRYYGPLLDKARISCVIPAPVDLAQFDPDVPHPGDAEDARLIASWGGRTVVGTVANVCPVKDLETLVRAAERLNRVMPGAEFVVVGPIYANQRAYHRRLEALKAERGVDNLHFVGGRRDVRALLARFDIYVCCSLAESSPVSVWEAMAMARPVVSTDVGDVACHVRDGRTGFVVEVGDDEGLADRCARLAADPALRRRCGAAARGVAEREFDAVAVARLTESFYREVLATKACTSVPDASAGGGAHIGADGGGGALGEARGRALGDGS